MNYNDILIKYIDKYPYDEPIFIENIKDYFKKSSDTFYLLNYLEL